MQNKSTETSLMQNSFTRRQFLTRTSLAVGAASLSFPYVGNVLGANERINVACIGVGGKGDSDSSDAARCGGNIVAICDVDQGTLDKKTEEFKGKFPEVKQYKDYRKLLDEMGKSIDAVTVSTPDHNHGIAAIRAMKLGKHAFCQKPLVQTVEEARIVRQLAKEKNLATQMGNQGSAGPGLRRAVEVIHGGVIGKPLELHVWSNRPVWPQGLERPQGEDQVPAGLNWDAWIGPAQPRPFKKGVYHTFNWRGWYEFGTGALGDMACHTVNMPFRALKLGYPNVVECELASRVYAETFPKTSRIRFEFPEREGFPALKFWWYDGNPGDALRPLRPDGPAIKEIISTYEKLPESGALIIGEKGKVFSPDDYGATFAFMNHGSFGACPRDVLVAQSEWRTKMEQQLVKFMTVDAPIGLKDSLTKLGAFVGAKEQDIVFVENATSGVNAVVRSLMPTFKPGDELFTTTHVYGAMRKTLHYAADVTGAKVVERTIPFPIQSADQVVEAVKSGITDKTKFAIIDHITSPSALVYPIERIIPLFKERGIPVMIDGAHALGMLDINMEKYGADFYTGNCHKWLYAPKGSAFLYVDPKHQKSIHPTNISHNYLTSFKSEFDWAGTHDPTAWLSVSAALAFIKEIGANEMRAYGHNLALEARKMLVKSWGTNFAAPEDMIGMLATLELPGNPKDTDKHTATLHDRLRDEFHCELPVIVLGDHTYVRISCQVYNDMSDYHRLDAAVKKIYS